MASIANLPLFTCYYEHMKKELITTTSDGFTLLELLIVAVAIAILVALYLIVS